MSDVHHAPPQAAARRAPGFYEAEDGGGWIGFAGTMILIVGILNVIYGLIAHGGRRNA